MSSLVALIGQLIVMFLYVGAGWLLYHAGKITEKGSAELSSLLLFLVLPAVIIKSFCVIPTAERIRALGESFLLTVLLLLAAMLLARLCFRKRAVDDFAAAFSNAGFIGIPLVQATLGEEAVFYIAPFITLLNLLQSTYGVGLLKGKSLSWDVSLLKNPFLVSTCIALVLFFTGIGVRLPQPVTTALAGVSSMNAPLAMLILGVYFAQTRFRTLFTDPFLYLGSLVRLLLIPAVSLLLCRLLPVSREISLALLIAASAPVGANVAVYAQREKLDYAYASKTVVLSTLFCVVTIPFVLYVAERIL